MLKYSFYVDSSSFTFKIHTVESLVSSPQSWPVYNAEARNQTFLISRFILQNNKIPIHDELPIPMDIKNAEILCLVLKKRTLELAFSVKYGWYSTCDLRRKIRIYSMVLTHFLAK